MNRRVLVVAYYWPPAGGVGVQRTMKFVEHLPAAGWDPTVVRVIYVVVSIVSIAFPGILVYLLLWIVMPPAE